MKTIVDAFVCRGTFEGKPYENGRLVIAEYETVKDPVPKFVYIAKCNTDTAIELKKHTPCQATLYYDRFKKVVGFQKV